MRFASPENFILLIAVLLLGVFLFYVIAKKKKLIKQFGDLPLIMKNSPFISMVRSV